MPLGRAFGMPFRGRRGAVVAYATWNPLDKSTEWVLSNGDLTATSNTSSPASGRSVRATSSKSSGKWYYEVRVDSRSSSNLFYTPALGIALGSFVLDSLPGSGADDSYIYSSGGNKRFGGSSTAYGSAYGPGDVVMTALDLDNGRLFWGLNGTWQNSGDPVAGTGAAFTGVSAVDWFPLLNYNARIIAVTARFDPASFSYSAPSGFSPWTA